MDKVLVTLNGETVEIERDAWDVLMRAFNVLVDSGDIGIEDGITPAALAKAKMASGSLYIIGRRQPRSDAA
jgi:hypothetical protein